MARSSSHPRPGRPRRTARAVGVVAALAAMLVAWRLLPDRDGAPPPPDDPRPTRSSPVSPGLALPEPTAEGDDLGPDRSPSTGATSTLPRMEVVHRDRRPQEVRAWTRVLHPFAEESVGPGGRVAVRPGDLVRVDTEDPRALVPRVEATVPDPVPGVWTLRVPAVDDPRLDEVVLEVVDATRRTPLAGAEVHWDETLPAPPRQRSDDRGRVTIALRGSRTPGFAALQAFLAGRACVTARGYRSAGGHSFHDAVEPSPLFERYELVGRWAETGVWVVPLEPLPPHRVEREVRLAHPGGEPLRDAYVALVNPLPTKVVRTLGSALVPGDVYRESRRTDADGRMWVTTFRAAAEHETLAGLGLEVRVAGVPFACFGLSADLWPASGPRLVDVPARADVEVVFEDLAGETVAWSTDDLGSALTLADTLDLAPPLAPLLDARAAARVEDGTWSFPLAGFGARGSSTGDPPALSLPVGVGSRLRLLLSRSGGGGSTLDVTAERPGPTLRRVRWRELPPR